MTIDMPTFSFNMFKMQTFYMYCINKIMFELNVYNRGVEKYCSEKDFML